jgi:hypothetical protein
MDKLDFFENLEPYEETREAAKLLVELASAPGQKYETIIKPSEPVKALSVSSEASFASPQIEESDSDEEIVTAQVEYADGQNLSSFLPEPMEPVFAEEEKERFNSSAPQFEPPMAIEESSPESASVPLETPFVMHTLDSQQQYAKEIVTTDDVVKEPKQITVEDFYYNEDQEPAKFEEQMVIEHTLPKIDFNQYLKEEDDIAPSVTPEVFKPSLESEEKTLLKMEKTEILPEPSAKAATVGEEDYAYDAAQSDASKFVLDLPLETPPHAQEDFYLIDQAALPDADGTIEKYDDNIKKTEAISENGKEYIADSFKDTDSYKISNIDEKVVSIAEQPGGPYTEITLHGEVPEEKAAEAIRTETESDAFITADENKKGKEFTYSEDKTTPEPAEEKRKISPLSLIDGIRSQTGKAIKIEPLKESKYESEEQILEEKPKLDTPVKKEIAFDSVREKAKRFTAVSKTEHAAYSEDKGKLDTQEPLEDKTPAPSGVEIDKLIAPDVSLKPQISSEPKKIEFPPLEHAGEQQSEKEDSAPPLLPFETSKIKTVFKNSKKFQESELPPFEIHKESRTAPELEIPPEGYKSQIEQPEVKGKDISKEKEELEGYDKILAEAQKEAEEFIRETIKKKQKEETIAGREDAKQEEPTSEQQDGQSFSDFLAKVKSQTNTEELKAKGAEDSGIPSALDDHLLRPTLDTPHVPEDIARMLPIIKPDSADKSRMDLPLKPSAAEIEDLKYKSVPLSIEDKEEPVKEPKLKSLFSRLIKKKDKEERIE